MTQRIGPLWRPILRSVSILLVGIALIIAGSLYDDVVLVSDTMTYGNFDAPPSQGQSGIAYLAPGTPDLASDKVYRFDGWVNWHPLVALSVLFVLILFWRVFRHDDLRTGSRRWLVQWLGFVGTRIGMLRAGQVLPVQRCSLGVLPLMNCQTCEMANGACPIAAFQVALQHQSLPMLAGGIMVSSGVMAGGWLCGWLCPFGLVEDLLDRFSVDRIRLPRNLEYTRYVMLGLVVLVPLTMGLLGITSVFPFCATICPSGMILGLTPYYLTTAKPGLAAILSDPSADWGAFGMVCAHTLGLFVYLGLALKMSGRFFCRYFCPLGAFLGLFNRVSLVQIRTDPDRCGKCTSCETVCPMGLKPQASDFLNATGCIRCGHCVNACPKDNRNWTFLPDRQQNRSHVEA